MSIVFNALVMFARIVFAPVKGYANARKGAHFVFTVMVWAVEIFAIAMVHDELIHLTLSTSVFAWESVILTIAD